MSRRVIGIFTLIVVLLGVLIPLNVGPLEVTGNAKDTVSEIKEKQIALLFSEPQTEKVDRYDWLKVENCSYMKEPGRPMLPFKNVIVKLPENSMITNVDVKAEETLLDKRYMILPAPLPAIVGSESSEEIHEDPTIYKTNDVFPSEGYVYREAHGIDSETVTRVKYLFLNLFPLRFLPIEGKVMLSERILITVRYIEQPRISSTSAGPKNLIVTSPLLQPHALDLGQWKNSTGMCSVVLSTEWIYSHYSGVDNQEKIRNCIKDYVANYGIMYVTIFGDADQVPVRYAYVPDEHETYTPTDLYYADLDGSWDDNHDGLFADQRYDDVDGIPDVYVGRIPPSLVEYARAAVDKIKGYQKHFDVSEDWTQRVVLAAGTCSGDGFSNTDKNGTTVLQEYIANIARDKNVMKLYQSAGNLSTAGLASEINKGTMFLGFAGHGDPGSGLFDVGWLLDWVIPGVWPEGFGISEVRSLTNGLKLPVVTTMSCSTARFDDTDCLGEWFVLEPSGGSIGYFGATRIAYGYFDKLAPYGFMGEMYRRIYENFYEGHTRLGQMWGESVSEYVANHIWDYRTAYHIDVKTAMEFVLLGDPTLNIGQDWDSSTVYLETAYTKLQSGASWSIVSDSSSWSGIVMKASSSSPNGGWLYGPYITTGWDDRAMVSNPYQVAFRLKTASNLFGNDVVRVDVACDAGTVLQSKLIRSDDFASANNWQEFKLTFVAPRSIKYGFEFRVLNLNHEITDIYVDKIEVTRLLDNSTACIEAAYNKQQDGTSWIKVSDFSSRSGFVMKAQSSSPNGGYLFGPYITNGWNGESMLNRPYRVFFRLRTTDNTSQSSIARIDICYNAGTVIQSMIIKANDFTSSYWQDFQLTFISPKSVAVGLEFRIINLNNGIADIFADWIIVQKEYDSSTCYVEAAYNKLQSGGSWSRVNDQSSYSGMVMKAQATSPNGGWLYGPYITTDWSGQTMLGKPFTATFRLKTSSIFSSNDLANIDICYNAGTVLQSVTIKADDFTTPNIWQNFNISFIVPKIMTRGLEFRVRNLNNGLADVYVDCIFADRQLNASTIYIEAAYGKQVTGNSWSKIIDSTSLSGTVMKASGSSSSGAWLYGPYIHKDSHGESMLGKLYTASLRLKISSNSSQNNVAYIDVCYNAGAIIIQSRILKASDFSSPNTWQEFQLKFTAPNMMKAGLEFRVFNLNHGVADVFVDYVDISPRWNASTAYAEGAYNKQRLGSSWFNVNDPSSWSGIVMKAAASSPNNDWLYGPYISSDWNARSMLGKSYVVSFRLKVSSNLSTDNVVRIDVCYNAGTVLQLMIIKANDFTSPNTWQDFQIAFTTPSYVTYGLEFRVTNLNNGVTDLFADQLLVNPIE